MRSYAGTERERETWTGGECMAGRNGNIHLKFPSAFAAVVQVILVGIVVSLMGTLGY